MGRRRSILTRAQELTGNEIAEALEQYGSMTLAAEELGITRHSLRRAINRLGVRGGRGWDRGTDGDPSVRILAIDIETRPNLAYVWSLRDQYIQPSALTEHQQVICWVAKWVGSDDVEFYSVHHNGRRMMVKRAWELLDQADVVLHYNGERFDVPHLNREFLQLGLRPPAPYKQIDLYKTARKEFAFASNTLEHVSKQLGLEGKVEHEGFGLWLKCLAGDDDAWARMRAYNERDVILLEQMYAKLRPWIRSHPSVAAFSGSRCCPGCGGGHLQARGFAITATGRYQRYQCTDCGRWSRETKRLTATPVTSVANS